MLTKDEIDVLKKLEEELKNYLADAPSEEQLKDQPFHSPEAKENLQVIREMFVEVRVRACVLSKVIDYFEKEIV